MSPSVVQWDAMTIFVECTLTQILKCLDEEVTWVLSNSRTNVLVEHDVNGFPPLSDSYCVETAHRSEHGAASSHFEL